MGAGGFGTALALVLSRNGHDVTLWDQNSKLVEKWAALRNSDRYPYLKKHRFPKNLQLSNTKILGAEYDFIIVSTSTSGIKGALANFVPDGRAPIVLIQKGMLPGLISPYDLAKSICPKETIMQFTGAGFAKDLANKAPAGMIVLHEPKDRSAAINFAELFRGSNIWPTCCTDLFGVNIHNSLRTIASFEQGFVYGYFQKKMLGKPAVSTIAITFSAISQEAKLIARKLRATKEIHDIESKVHRILEADLMLCQSDSSRNFALGHYIGRGHDIKVAESMLKEGVAECINNIDSIHSSLLKKLNEDILKQKFPYLHAAKNLNSGGSAGEEIKNILAHHESYVA